MSTDARIRFTAEGSAELPFTEDAPMPEATTTLALARTPDPLDYLRAKVDRAELLARQAEANLRLAVARADLIETRSQAAKRD